MLLFTRVLLLNLSFKVKSFDLGEEILEYHLFSDQYVF